MRAFLVLLTLAALLAAGCIQPSEPQPGDATPAAPAPTDRIDGMTADVQKTDKAVDCGSGGTQVPPRFCAERNLTVTGRIGVASLPVSLSTPTGGVIVRAGQGDAWSFHALVRVSAPTQDMADQGLDTAWTWSHEKEGRHALEARPTGAANASPVPLPVDAPLGAAQVDSARYEVTLPAWVKLDSVEIDATNGGVVVTGFEAGRVDLSSTNGGVGFTGRASDVSLRTTNGGVALDLAPTATGTVALKSTNGGIAATLHQGPGRGFDVDGKSTNGGVSIQLAGAQTSANERGHKHVRTDGFDAAPVQTTLQATSTNGGVSVLGS